MKKILPFALMFSLSTSAFSYDFIGEAKEDLSSPVTTDAWKVLAIGSGLTLITYAFKDTFRDDLQKDIGSDKPLGKTSKFGDFLGHSVPNIAYALYMGGDYLLTKDKKALDRTILMTKATLYSGVLTDTLKISIHESRPNNGQHSFPSGHTTTAAAFASVVAMEHSVPWGIAAVTMASFVGLSRMNDNAHYLHDVIAGGTIGAMYGVGVCLAARNREVKPLENPSVFMVLPIEKGLATQYSMSF
jgi:hypothetical protein